MHTNLSKQLTLCQIAFSDPSINLCDDPPIKGALESESGPY